MELGELVSTALKTLDFKFVLIKDGFQIYLLKAKASLEKSVGDINNKYQSIQDYINDIDGFLIINHRETRPVKEQVKNYNEVSKIIYDH